MIFIQMHKYYLFILGALGLGLQFKAPFYTHFSPLFKSCSLFLNLDRDVWGLRLCLSHPYTAGLWVYNCMETPCMQFKERGLWFLLLIMPNNFQMGIRKTKPNTNRSLKFHCIGKTFPLQKLKIII